MPVLTYDTRGNLTGIGSAAYGYSSQNQLLSGPNAANLTYDPAMRLYKTGNASGATKFQYDGTDIIAEYSNGNVLLRRYVHGPGPSTGSGQANQPIVQYEGTDLTTKRFFTADERGSVIAVTDSAGTPIATNRYDEYGNPATTNASISNGGRFEYTGQAWLPEIGLYHYKARTYNPILGRFMQSDPIGYGDGMNMNNYVGGDPVNFVDPMGLCVTVGDYPPVNCPTPQPSSGGTCVGTDCIYNPRWTPPRTTVITKGGSGSSPEVGPVDSDKPKYCSTPLYVAGQLADTTGGNLITVGGITIAVGAVSLAATPVTGGTSVPPGAVAMGAGTEMITIGALGVLSGKFAKHAAASQSGSDSNFETVDLTASLVSFSLLTGNNPIGAAASQYISSEFINHNLENPCE